MHASYGIRIPGLVPNYADSLSDMVDYIVELERIGFDDVVDSELVLFSPAMQPPCDTRNMVHGRDIQRSDRADTMVVLATIAARTTRIKLASASVHVAVHGFAVIARQASTLDVLSKGRFLFGVGSGWNGTVSAVQGVPPAEGTARTEETVRACRALWQPGLSSFHGRWINFDDVVSEPAPLTPGGPPVWYSGNATSGATIRRVLELSDGWISREQASYDEIAASIESIQMACLRAGRDPDTVGFRASIMPISECEDAGTPNDLIERMVSASQRLAAVGVTHFTIPLSYFRLTLDDLDLLLKSLRAQ